MNSHSQSTKKSLDHSVKEGCAHAVMLASGEAYLAPFAVFLKSGSLVIGLLSSVPVLLGSLIQLASITLLDRITHRKTLIVYPALVQACLWLPLLLVPLSFPNHARGLLIACALVYFAVSGLIAPAWNSLMGDLTDPASRSSYFGQRDKLRTAFHLVSLCVAGGILNWAEHHHREAWGFAAIFTIAMIARFVSAYHFHKMGEPKYVHPTREQTFTFRTFIKRAPKNNFGLFCIYVSCMMLAVNIGGPFVTLYMLRDLGFSYLEFTAASMINIFTQILTLHNWGKAGDRYGNLRIIRVTGSCMAIFPLMWMLTSNFTVILLIQALAGVIWSGFNLSAANFLFDAVTPPKRARCVAYYNVLTNSGLVAGALIGGLLAPHFPRAISVFGISYPLASNLAYVFFLSGCARMAVAFIFLPLIKEVRKVEPTTSWRLLTQLVGVSPLRGMRLPAHPHHANEELPKTNIGTKVEPN